MAASISSAIFAARQSLKAANFNKSLHRDFYSFKRILFKKISSLQRFVTACGSLEALERSWTGFPVSTERRMPGTAFPSSLTAGLN